jgi:hypothetical protein
MQAVIQCPITYLALRAEALHLGNRTVEALEAITEAEAMLERTDEERWWCAELHRLRGVFLTAIGSDEVQIEASFHDAIRISKEQYSLSWATCSEDTFAEYRRQIPTTSLSTKRLRGFNATVQRQKKENR